MRPKKYATLLDEQLDNLDGPGPRRAGDRWPTHRAKARDARSAKPTLSEEDSE
ncbi:MULTISPECIES: hypothetical protein [Actinomycetes]|uniref:hypothetical protein n=1 Tax=Actinomycetes TaxID=1760 RepID=UPI000AE33540|nr:MULTISPECIES: hypothetical protein [Actinomycetes]